jgi:hypothetical protein
MKDDEGPNENILCFGNSAHVFLSTGRRWDNVENTDKIHSSNEGRYNRNNSKHGIAMTGRKRVGYMIGPDY